LANYFVVLFPPWMPAEDALDNWQNSPRGRSAKALIEAAHDKEN